MKHVWMEWVLAFFLGGVVPWLLCGLMAENVTEDIPETQIDLTVTMPEEATISVLDHGIVECMRLEDYLTGVLLGEMPGSFAMEAKKAQAVVARTYALRVAAGDRHDGAVCTDSGCCQSYRDPGEEASWAVEEARTAVVETEGMVLTYGGKLIDATYFSCSGGMTEDAMAVWGADVPYLQAVESPGEEAAAYFTDTVSFTQDEFETAIGKALPSDKQCWFGRVCYTQGGGVDTIEIGGDLYTGLQLRRRLDLRSTNFSIAAEDGRINVTTKGFGHRVGMSQYGADAMARNGGDFSQILTHYYQGAVLTENWG